MAILKDGSTVKDPRLARVIQFDERSKNFPIRAVIENTTPRSYTWSCATHLDQGNEGACVGFSMAHELIAKPVVIAGINAKFARENIYWQAQRNDQWPGGEYPGGSPKYEGTSVLAGIQTLQKLGYVTEYRWAFGLDDLVLAVGRKGPAVLGINWYEGMFDVQKDGYVRVSGNIAGGHAILCKGVNIPKKYFTLHNSWGPSWGVNGDAKISWADMDKLLKDSGEAVIPLSRKAI